VEEELKHQRELILNVMKMMDKRFEDLRTDMSNRFEQVDKRFEDMRVDMNIRFEQVDKRFEDMRTDMSNRFEQVDRRFSMLMWFIGIGFTLVTTIITGVFVLLK